VVANLRRLAAVLVLSLLAVGIVAAPAQAHAVLERSDPADGAALGMAPSAIDLWFSEEIVPALSDGHLVDATGRPIEGGTLSADPTDAQHLVLDAPSLDAGSYGVLWRVVAADDAHTTTGVIVFSVATGDAPTAIAVASQGSTPASIVRWLRISALAAVVGGLAMLVVVFRRVRRALDAGPALRTVELTEYRIAVATMYGAVAVAICTGLALTVRLWETPGPDLALLSTRWGTTWLLGEAIVLVVVALTTVLRRRVRDGGRATENLLAAAALFASFLIPLEAVQSHAAALGSTGALLAATAHTLAGLLWIGAVAMFALVLWTLRGLPQRATILRAMRRPFSWMAAFSVAVLVATGLLEAGAEVTTPGDLLATSYGRLLLLKGALLAIAASLGLRNARRLHGGRRRYPGTRLSRGTVLAEAAVGVVILLAAAALSDTPPAIERPASAAPAATPRTFSASVDDLLTTLSLTPNRPGVNGVTVVATSTRRPAPAPIDRVVLRLMPPEGGGPIELPLRSVGDDKYFGSADIEETGGWHASILVARAGERISLPVRWSVDPTPPPPAPTAPRRTLAPITDVMALLVAAAAICVGGVTLARRRRRSGPPERPEPEDEPPAAAKRPALEVVR